MYIKVSCPLPTRKFVFLAPPPGHRAIFNLKSASQDFCTINLEHLQSLKFFWFAINYNLIKVKSALFKCVLVCKLLHYFSEKTRKVVNFTKC